MLCTTADGPELFRKASMGGGTPPQWTEESEPSKWLGAVPADAAGGLYWLGETAPSPNQGSISESTWADLEPPETWRLLGAYFSSGGRGVFLAALDAETSYVVIARTGWHPSGEPYLGTAEGLCDETYLLPEGLSGSWRPCP